MPARQCTRTRPAVWGRDGGGVEGAEAGRAMWREGLGGVGVLFALLALSENRTYIPFASRALLIKSTHSSKRAAMSAAASGWSCSIYVREG